MKIIVNADDFGISRQVNDAILDLINAGHITSTTLLANGPAIKDAIERIPEGNNCSFGVHLNISEFKPLTDTHQLQSLLNTTGCFKYNFEDLHISSAVKKAIFVEWCAQIEKILQHGINISHIDSHNHVHTLPQLFFTLKKVQRKYAIRKVRITKNIYTENLPCQSRILFFKKQLWILLLKNVFWTKTTSGFTDLISFLDPMVQKQMHHKIIEIMVHPGSDLFEEDLSTLKAGHLTRLPMNLIFQNYHDL